MQKLPFDSARPHHKKKNLPEERQLEILRAAHWGTLATATADGEPYCTPIGFAYDETDGSLVFHTANQGIKTTNLANDTRVCFSIVGSANLVAGKFASTFESLLVFGNMARIEDEQEAYRAALTFCRKFAPAATEELLQAKDEEGVSDLARMMQKASELMSMYRLVPSHISGKQRTR